MNEKILEENKNLKEKVNLLKKEMLKNKLEFETKNGNLNRIMDLFNLISSETNLKKIIQTVFNYLNNIIPFDTATLVLKSNDDRFLYQTIIKNEKKLFSTPKHENKLSEFLLDLVYNNKQSILAKNFDELLQLTENNVALQSTSSCFAIPVYYENTEENFVLVCESKTSEVYTEKEVFEIINLLNGISGVIKNALEFSNMNERITKDELTKVFNRKYFLLSLDKEIKHANETGADFTVVITDVDCFKNINSKNTHFFGDKVLEHISRLLARTLRSMDILARYGGEEFIILLPNTTAKTAQSICERLRRLIENKTRLTLSFGIATYHSKRSDIDIVSRADLALAEAKKNGKNKVIYYENII